MNKRVFVSSTYNDLLDYREAVRKAIRQLGAVDISMENFGARDETPKLGFVHFLDRIALAGYARFKPNGQEGVNHA